MGNAPRGATRNGPKDKTAPLRPEKGKRAETVSANSRVARRRDAAVGSKLSVRFCNKAKLFVSLQNQEGLTEEITQESSDVKKLGKFDLARAEHTTDF
jgi:hypothetical protein